MIAELGALPAGSALIRLLWLTSPALPVGWVHDGESARSWIQGVLARQVAMLDAPVLARMHDAYTNDQPAEAVRWAEFLAAARESAEFALEDRQLGMSLAKLLRDSGALDASMDIGPCGYAQMFALACVRWGVSRVDAVLAYLFAFAEGQVTAASKLVPLGQVASQRALAALMAGIEGHAREALALPDDAIGAHTPGLAIASALHEVQYSRLFRS
jgi:urease accessory protein